MKTRQQVFDELQRDHARTWPDYLKMDLEQRAQLFAWKRQWWIQLLNVFPQESDERGHRWV